MQVRGAQQVLWGLMSSHFWPTPMQHMVSLKLWQFALHLSVSEAAAICSHIDVALAAPALADAPPIAGTSLKGFAAAWREYLRSLEREAAC